MQFKVPQDVLRADKIVGFLTLRQVIICALGGGIAYSLYTVLSKQYLSEIWVPPVIFVVLVTMAFAFVRFHDISFEKLSLLFIEYKFKPHARVWLKMKGDVVASVFSTVQVKDKKKKKEKEKTDDDRRKKLLEVTRVVDTGSTDITASIIEAKTDAPVVANQESGKTTNSNTTQAEQMTK